MATSPRRLGDGPSFLPVLIPCCMGLFVKKGSPGSDALVRARRDGRPLRVVYWHSAIINPLTETVEFFERRSVTLEMALKGIEATSGGDRIPVNLVLVVQVLNHNPRMMTPENIDRALRVSREEVEGQVRTAVERHLREICVQWTPEALRDRPPALTERVRRAADFDITLTGWTASSVVIKDVTEDIGYFDLYDLPKRLETYRQALRAAGFDPGPEPSWPMSREEAVAEYNRIKPLLNQLL
jgi:uncharacterized membrane protein YqiK